MDENQANKKEEPYLILIIEDDPLLSHMYDEKFKTEGFATLIANNGSDGLKLALEKQPALVLLDIMLPKGDGMSVLKRLRDDEKGKNIPVIALTNKTERESAKEAMKYGAKEYLTKAMQSPEDVIQKVKSHLGMS